MAEILGLKETDVRFSKPMVGGGFGARQQLHAQHVAALMSKKIKRPVNLSYSREEDLYSVVRHGSDVDLRIGATKDGKLKLFDTVFRLNAGPYTTHTPTVVAGTMEDGEFVKAAAREPVRETVSEETSAKMREMLYNTRKAWRNTGLDAAGYYVGGKTGTAQVIRDGAYVLDETVATYIGFGGTEGEMPEYVIMVRVWEDGKVAGGQEHALPVFNALKTAVQDELKVRPAGM